MTRRTDMPGDLAREAGLMNLPAPPDTAGSATWHSGVLYGIRHPGPGRVGCPYCTQTLEQTLSVGVTPRWPYPADLTAVRELLNQHRRLRNVRGCSACSWTPEHPGNTDAPEATRRRHEAFNAHLARLITEAIT
jgi:hypothetical protein